VVLEVIRSRLDSVNEDAASILRRVSGSQIAVEANDLNTVIMAADGRVVACGRYVLIQTASMHLVVADILAHYTESPGIGEGDQFITNDPYVGTLHQPDVVVAAPIFVDGRLVAWCASVVHQSDVGGPTPGGITYDARSIFDEAVPMPPIKIVEGGRLRPDVEREYLVRSRVPELNALDLAGQIAANRETAAQVQALCGRYGTDTVTGALDALLAAAERQLRARLASLPDGRWRHVAHVVYRHRPARAADEPVDEIYVVRLTMTKRGEHLTLDFSESDDQAPGAINASRPALVNFAMGAVLIYLCNGLHWIPGGVWPVVDLVSREGSVVHARWPAGVAMSTSATGQAIRVCVNACVARMLETSDELAPLVMASCQFAGAGACAVSGTTERGGVFATMTTDDISGGGGARSGRDGADSSGFTTSPGAAVANVEVNESYLPLRYLQRRELADTGGAGRWRGGVGTAQAVVPHRAGSPVSVLSFGQGLLQPCAVGVAGGWPGAGSGFALLPEQVARALLAGTSGGLDAPMPHADMTFAAGEAELVVSQGGGGLGDPIERDPEAVAADVGEGLVSPAAARRLYGVVVRDRPGGPVPDEAATAEARRALRSARLGGAVPAPPADAPDGRPFSWAFVTAGGILHCRRCASAVGRQDELWERLRVDELPTTATAPLGLRYPGADAFCLRALHCPACGRQVEVQVARRDEPVLVAAELF
jgi:N-methylhydantoinase B